MNEEDKDVCAENTDITNLTEAVQLFLNAVAANQKPPTSKKPKKPKAHFSQDFLKDYLASIGMTIRKNVITNRIEFNNTSYKKIEEEDRYNKLVVDIKEYCAELGVAGSSIDIIHRTINAVAATEAYNPVEKMLIEKAWDGKDRMPELFRILGIGGAERRFDQLLTAKWLLQSVAMALNDSESPYGAEGILVLQGNQFGGKTSFFREITPDQNYFLESAKIGTGSKDEIISVTTSWIVELGEIDNCTRREACEYKGFITQRSDKYRPPYGRNDVLRARRSSLCGTVNPDDFLKDPTGNRRFWVIPVNEIDTQALRGWTYEEKQQLWAQVYGWFKVDPQGFRLTKDECKELNRRNDEMFTVLKKGEAEILDLLVLEPGDRIPMVSVLAEIKSHEIVRCPKLFASRLSVQEAGYAMAAIVRKYPQFTCKRTSRGKVYTFEFKNKHDLEDSSDKSLSASPPKYFGRVISTCGVAPQITPENEINSDVNA